MQHLIKKHVLNGEFDLVRQLMSETDFMEFEEAYISSAHEVESMMFYTCILDMIKYEESSEMHDLAFLLLVYPLSEYEGALDSAYYHADASINLLTAKKLKVCYKCYYCMRYQHLLFQIRRLLISPSKFKLDPNNNVARNVLKDTAKRMDNVVVDINELHQRNAR